jgi:hypothetical protein
MFNKHSLSQTNVYRERLIIGNVIGKYVIQVVLDKAAASE